MASETQLTPEQQAALSAHEQSVSLAAGAGCGKTFVLTERFLSYLDPRQLQPSAELTELVAITFTDAAAREMRERIRNRCYQRLDAAQEPSERAAWKQLLASLDGARISTIHSFCGKLLRTHAAEAGVDPRFELLDGPATQLLKIQCLDNHLRHLLVRGDEQVIQLATFFGLGKLRDHIATLLGDDVQHVAAHWSDTNPAELVAHWREHFEREVAPTALATMAGDPRLAQLRSLLSTADTEKEKFKTALVELADLIDSLSDTDNPLAAARRLGELARVQGFCTAKDFASKEDFENYKQACTAVRDKVLKSSVLSRPLDTAVMEAAAQVGLDLLQLVADVEHRYSRAKQQRNVLEFDDLLNLTEKLLSSDDYPQIRQQLARGTRLLMVDEFQDTNPQQVAIVKALRGEAWAEQGLFVVGDFKQSIYRFNGAEPRVSSQLRSTLPEQGQLSLTTNFRSQPAILDFVNALFHDAFAEKYEPLLPHRPQLSPTPAVEFLWSQPDPNPSDADLRLSKTGRARLQEARYIARRLAQLIDDGQPLVVDASAGRPEARPLRLGDIAILLRSLSDVPIYEEALREYGLEYYLAGGHAFYAQQEIQDVLHLLRAIVSPADELSLAGVLRSPMFALTDETLFWLVEQAGSLNAGLFGEELPPQLSPTEQAKVSRAATTLSELRACKDQLLVSELLEQSIATTGYDAILLTEFLGHRKWANVQKLLDQARSLDQTRPGDLSGFVTQLTEFVVRTPKEPLAATRAEGDVIRIMTIHYSKGLEFPLVVVPDLDRQLHSGDRRPVFDLELGPMVPNQDSKSPELVGWDLYHFDEREQDKQESLRLLYVACTRAADYLLLSSSLEDPHQPKYDWLQFLAEHFDLADGTCLKPLPEGCNVPEIRVTTSEPPTQRKPMGPTRGADLHKLIARTQKLAEAGKGLIPAEVAPIAVDPAAQLRYSVSRLTGQLSGPDLDHDEESTDVENSLDARGLGNLVHAVLERLDFASPQANLDQLCQFLAPQFLEDAAEQAADEAHALVKAFLASPQAKQLAAARDVRREIEFLLPWPLENRPGVYLQGYIDCLYQDQAGAWHLLDYKTNRVTADQVAQAAVAYELQLFVYHTACEQAFGVAPVESTLHFLRPAAEHSFAWDDAARGRLRAAIDAGIQSDSASI